MDRQRKKKIEKARVIITNIFMALCVVGIVFVLMLVAMGYSVNENGIQQSGLVQISSNPKGAIVEIDGEIQFDHTNFNKMLRSGNHNVKITKPGYDAWEKTINVDSGYLTRVEWARLFPTDNNVASIINLSDIRLAEFSDDHKRLFVIEHGSPVAQYYDIQNEKIKTHKISLTDALSDKTENVSAGEIHFIAWNEASSKILITWTHDQKTTWHLIDLENAQKSINLTTKFGMTFSDIRILNDSASKLWVLENGRIHIIDTENQTITGVIASNVDRFANNKDVISYVGIDNDDDSHCKLFVFKDGEKGATEITSLESKQSSITLAMGSYWNESWLAYSVNNRIAVLSGTYPSYDKPSNNSLDKIVERDLEYAPNLVSTNRLGRIVAFTGASNLTSIDIETRNYYDTTTEAETTKLNWLDSYLIWETSNDKIIVRDFDGNNRREILSVDNALPVNITENNRWLYYFDIIPSEAEADGAQNDVDAPITLYSLKRKKLE